MRCLWFHIEYPFLRMSERWISKANHFLNGVDFCKQSLIFQFQLQKQDGETADNSNTMKLWRTLIYEAPNLRESNGLFLYSQCHGSSLKDLECCVIFMGVCFPRWKSIKHWVLTVSILGLTAICAYLYCVLVGLLGFQLPSNLKENAQNMTKSRANQTWVITC